MAAPDATRSIPAWLALAAFAAALVWGAAEAVAPPRVGGGDAAGAARVDPFTRLAQARGQRRSDEALASIAGVLLDRGVTRGDLRFERQAPATGGLVKTELGVDVPGDVSPVANALTTKLSALSGARVRRDLGRADCERLTLALDGVDVASVELYAIDGGSMVATSAAAPAAAPPSGPRVVIVLDDVGYSREPVDRLLAVSPDITFSVLPYAPYSAELAEKIHDAGAEVMLHLPMEPEKQEGYSREGMLLSNMPEAMLRDRIAEALLKVPHADGVNNHMGSLLTAKADAMGVVMSEMKARGLFFLDSRTSAGSVAYRTAREAGVPALERNVFLDDVAEPKAIEQQVATLESIAKKRGEAVAIGHPYAATVEALAQAVPKLEKDGLVVVRADALVR